MPETPSQTRVEGKYSFRAGDQTIIRAGLDATLVKDPSHHHGRVNSIYFDTPHLSHLGEKINSDYLKTKIRLRWYGHQKGSDPRRLIPAYLEVKRKEGRSGNKSRRTLEVPEAFLWDNGTSFHGLMDLVNDFRELGYVPSGPVFPMISIHYSRTRYIEPESGGRVSLDYDIGYTRTNQDFIPVSEPRTFRFGVLEIKNETGDLPRSLLGIRNRLNKRDSFSKYEECWQLNANPFYRRDFQWMHFRK